MSDRLTPGSLIYYEVVDPYEDKIRALQRGWDAAKAALHKKTRDLDACEFLLDLSRDTIRRQQRELDKARGKLADLQDELWAIDCGRLARGGDARDRGHDGRGDDEWSVKMNEFANKTHERVAMRARRHYWRTRYDVDSDEPLPSKQVEAAMRAVCIELFRRGH